MHKVYLESLKEITEHKLLISNPYRDFVKSRLMETLPVHQKQHFEFPQIKVATEGDGGVGKVSHYHYSDVVSLTIIHFIRLVFGLHFFKKSFQKNIFQLFMV
jgi:hypothetical protein